MRLSRLLGRTMLALVCSAGTTGAFAADEASEAEAIRQELKTLKQDYERRIEALEERLRRLEKHVPPGATTPAGAVVPAGAETNSRCLGDNWAVAPAECRVPPLNRKMTYAHWWNAPFSKTPRRASIALHQTNPLYQQRMEEVMGGFVKVGGYLRGGLWPQCERRRSPSGFPSARGIVKIPVGQRSGNVR